MDPRDLFCGNVGFYCEVVERQTLLVVVESLLSVLRGQCVVFSTDRVAAGGCRGGSPEVQSFSALLTLAWIFSRSEKFKT